MKKGVLISIQPKWCELIASGKKTVEVRKTRPKLEVPFKCYIYCTKPVNAWGLCRDKYGVGLLHKSNFDIAKSKGFDIIHGTVIGEFVCDYITGLKADNMVQAYYNNTKDTCLTDEDIKNYASGKKLYYWHISELVIYDTPRKLSEFEARCEWYEKYPHKKCYKCEYNEIVNGGIVACVCCGYKPMTRPPQSWCYVEERSNDNA